MMETFTSKIQPINSEHQTNHTTWLEVFKNELQKEEHVKKELEKNEIEALKDLSIRDDIKFIKADKGGAVVFIDVDDYINEMNRQLNNTEFYKEIRNNPTELNRKKRQQCNQRTKICKITGQKDSDKAASSRSKNTGVLCFQKYTSQKTQADQ